MEILLPYFLFGIAGLGAIVLLVLTIKVLLRVGPLEIPIIGPVYLLILPALGLLVGGYFGYLLYGLLCGVGLTAMVYGFKYLVEQEALEKSLHPEAEHMKPTKTQPSSGIKLTPYEKSQLSIVDAAFNLSDEEKEYLKKVNREKESEQKTHKFITSAKGKTPEQIARELYNFVAGERRRLNNEKNSAKKKLHKKRN